MIPDPDRALVLSCQDTAEEGFNGPFRDLYERYKGRVYNVCHRITGNQADALDASQETFGILFRKLGDFRFDSKFSSWIYRIAVNASIDLKRRAASRSAISLDQIQSGDDAGQRKGEFEDTREPGPLASVFKGELEQEVQAAITRLSPKMRAITVLRYTESLSYEEIAETLGTSLGTVKSRLSRAHAALDRELTPVLDRHGLR